MEKENGVIAVGFPKEQLAKEYGVKLEDFPKDHLLEIAFDEKKTSLERLVRALKQAQIKAAVVSGPLDRKPKENFGIVY